MSKEQETPEAQIDAEIEAVNEEQAHTELGEHEYTIDEPLCIGCAKCVKGCNAFGNGSLFLQVRHDRCLNCNECSIAAACPSQAYKRVPSNEPYLIKEARHG